MNTAFSVAYPPERSLMARALLPLVHWRTYLRAIHFLLMFPLGIGYFVFFVTAFAVGGSLIWTFVGPPIILLALFISLYLGDLEGWMVNVSTGAGIRRPPKVVEGAHSLREKVWTRFIDPSTWTGVVYEIVQFPAGVAAFMVVVGGFSAALWFTAGPVLIWLSPDSLDIGSGPFNVTIEDSWHSALFIPLGVLAWFVTMHLITVLSVAHSMWARIMLGSRGRRRRDPDPPSGPQPEPRHPAIRPPEEPGSTAPARAFLAVEPPLDDSDGPAPAPGTHPALVELTVREREVLALVVRGYSNADVCEELYVSEGTVKTHIRHILSKLNLTDRTQLVVFAYEQGVILPEPRPVPAIASMR